MTNSELAHVKLLERMVREMGDTIERLVDERKSLECDVVGLRMELEELQAENTILKASKERK